MSLIELRAFQKVALATFGEEFTDSPLIDNGGPLPMTRALGEFLGVVN